MQQEVEKPLSEVDSPTDSGSFSSFFEDIVDAAGVSDEEIGDEQLLTTEKCEEIRDFLRSHGQNQFVDKYLLNDDNALSVREVLYALRVKVPAVLELVEGEALAPLLSLAISRELSRRDPLPDVSTLDDVVEVIKKSNKIVLLTGAGISTSLGIPDFRSDRGVYAKLEAMGLSEPQEVFDLHVFREDPTVFYTFAKEILPSVTRFSPTHKFVKILQDKGKLLTDYTQNIDNLKILMAYREAYAEVDSDKIVQCHGSFAYATCQTCGHRVRGTELFDDIRNGVVSRCKQPYTTANAIVAATFGALKRKRAGSDESDGSDREQETQRDTCNGVMKPDITFFGEALPKAFETRLLGTDVHECDLLICIGTSLKVAPVSQIIQVLPPSVPQIYISLTPCKHAEFDVSLLGSCDDVIIYLCNQLGWKLEHEMVPDKFETKIEHTAERTYAFLKPEADDSKNEAGVPWEGKREIDNLDDAASVEIV
ncbi:DHS-like NAD/FAD-binding domain-containing protein [Lipomyces arxii]|uniref:DHS-like NAD/FAD-binding domain-containing protein n=1 Tax=Lipomyces arxii TaxID=56418 RepID=UPI0034CF87E0